MIDLCKILLMNELPPKIDLSYCLSDFQLEILNDICNGLRVRQMAEKHYKSIGSINHAIQSIYAKLDCNNYIGLFKILYGFSPAPDRLEINPQANGIGEIIRLHIKGLKASQISQRTGNSRNYIYNVINSYKAIKKLESEN